MKKQLLLLLGLFLMSTAIFAQTSIEGKIKDLENNGAGLFPADIVIYKNDVFVQGTVTDYDGNYVITGIEPGNYDIEVSSLGYKPIKQTGVTIQEGKANKVDIEMGVGTGIELDVFIITAYKAPLIEQDNTTQGKTVTAAEIRALPTKNINAIAATSAGISTDDRSDDVSIRGSRPDATNIYVDGVRVSASSIPASEIDQLQVITGGMEAKYGDVTGGVISITSKGPSSKYTGGVEAETSIDGFGYNLLSANVSGPIIKKDGKSILGFRLAGQYLDVKDNSPTANGTFALPEEQIRLLEANPTGFVGNTEFPSAQFIGAEQMGEVSKVRPNVGEVDYNVTAKLDAKISDGIDLTFSGGFSANEDQFTPGNAAGGGAPQWRILNWVNNPFRYQEGFRTSLRFRHRIGKQGLGNEDGDTTQVSSLRNAFYSLQVGYEKRNSRREDTRHQDDLFAYGHYGSQANQWDANAAIVTDPDNWGGNLYFDGLGRPWSHLGYAQTTGEFSDAGSSNPILARYTQQNGFTESPLFDVWGGLYENVGQVYNRFDKSESERRTLNVNAGFDFLPGGSESGRHSLQLGFNYEQRVDRSYVITPERLWILARLNANRHIIGVDTTNVIGSFMAQLPDGLGGNFTQMMDQYQTLIEADDDLSFFKRVRAATGKTLHEYVNVDELTPDQMKLEFFSAAELNNFNLISYYGYDYLGNKLSNATKFDDFFTSEDDDGVRTFDVAPLQPIYMAGFLQDKFSYRDVIFRLGVRVDYYDANSKVLKDPYALYDIETAEQFYSRTGGTRPDNIDPDFKVYVTEEDGESVQAYRSGDRFILPNGTEVANANALFSGEVNPSYVQRDGDLRDISSRDFSVDDSFEDYTAQFNVMPRLAFSFPISDEANFFAHYDILVQRPPTGTEATARSYYYFNNPDRTPTDNPNLKPEKTIDYEVGFQQKLSNSSAIKVSAYYKELRDMIQQRTYFNVPSPVNSYQAYGNIDFGTVKGLSFNYDLRRTNNIQLTANYTLQFADGTGSDPDFAEDLVSRGNIRTLLPLSFDERHRLTATVDYRYGAGAKYDGPKLFGKDVFADVGVNFVLTGISGRPYSRLLSVENISQGTGNQYLGSINGARLPWQYRIDTRVDKSFAIGLGGEGSRKLRCNVYLRVSNLLNTKNVTEVFPVSGDPDDDGYLVSSFGVDRQEQIVNANLELNNFLSSYQWRLLDAGHYALPRRIYVGAIFDF